MRARRCVDYGRRQDPPGAALQVVALKSPSREFALMHVEPGPPTPACDRFTGNDENKAILARGGGGGGGGEAVPWSWLGLLREVADGNRVHRFERRRFITGSHPRCRRRSQRQTDTSSAEVCSRPGSREHRSSYCHGAALPAPVVLNQRSAKQELAAATAVAFATERARASFVSGRHEEGWAKDFGRKTARLGVEGGVHSSRWSPRGRGEAPRRGARFAHFGRSDVAVNNAGTGAQTWPVTEFTGRKATPRCSTQCARHALRHENMRCALCRRRARGSIVNHLVDQWAERGSANMSLYAQARNPGKASPSPQPSNDAAFGVA